MEYNGLAMSQHPTVHGSAHQHYPMTYPGQAQQQYLQLPIRKEVDEEGRICSVVLPKNTTEHSSEENNGTNLPSTKEDLPSHIASEEQDERLSDCSQKGIKIEYDDDDEHVTGKVKKKKKKKGVKDTKKKRKKRRTKMKLSGNIYECDDCPATFPLARLLKAHSKVHLEDSESHTCTACGVVFPRLGKLMKHRLEIHEDALQCPHCDKQYTVIKNYQFHVNTHKEDKDRPFICEMCDKGFFSRTTLEDHYLKHSGFKPYMCGYCEKMFKSIGNLNQHHQRVHSEEGSKPKTCDYCGKTFATARSLASHRNIHISPFFMEKRTKTYECPECGWTHIKKSKFETHMRTHTGEKPYVCNLCDSRFNEKSSLKRHKMTHTGAKPFKCNFCPSAFLTKRERKLHNMVHSGKPFQCPLCDYTCLRKQGMEYHMNTHTGKTPYKCHFLGCNAEYSSPNHLRSHRLKVHLPPQLKTCKLCNEKFPDLKTLNQHMAMHAGNNPLACDQCDKIFYDQSSLNRHVHKHTNEPNENKPKQVRKRKTNNPVVKRVDKPEPTTTQNKFPSAVYEVPDTFNQSWNHGTLHGHQPHFLASQYPHLDPTRASTIDPEEIRRQLFNRFK